MDRLELPAGAPARRRPRMRAGRGPLALLAIVASLLAVPVALAAAPPQPLPGQRIDMKVLLIGTPTDGVFAAWKAQLDRTGTPYATWSPGGPAFDDAFLADYGANRARFQAVITAADNVLTTTQQAALTKFEETFGVRQISDNTAGTAHGLTNPTAAQSGEQGGVTANLTAAGKLAFPYLRGPVPLPPRGENGDIGVFGYQATPLPGANFTTLLEGPNASAFLGINVRANGTEEMVNTVPGNQFQSHHQLLRDGMLNWVTRGVYLGYARNHLGLDIDDVFLPDDKWDAIANRTDYNATIRMDAQDVRDAVTWQNRTGLKLNMVYNMAGVADGTTESRELLTAFQQNKNEFRWINHTYSHPNLDCTNRAFTAFEITENQRLFDQQIKPGLAPGLNDPSELVTGEHSGLANLIPGNPGTIDPPFFVRSTAGATGTGTLADANYEYGITASTASGETPASFVTVDAAANGSATVAWESVCKATSYKLYRHVAGTTGGWELIHTSTGTTAFDHAGAVAISFTDTGAAGTPAAPPADNTALKAPHGQNPDLAGALTDGGIRSLASDTSKPYPNPSDSPNVDAGAAGNHAPGSSFPVGPARTVPRYPTNLYYNVANRADQLDEYNFGYTPDDPATAAVEGACVASATNTCRTSPASWADYMNSEVGIMFGHVVGNDPRPHYFHQTNIAAYDPNAADTATATGGTLYAVVNTLLARYNAAFDRTTTPLVQLSQADVARTLVRQNAWKAAMGTVDAYIQDGEVRISAPAGTEVPVTGTEAGTAYAGTRSGWTTTAAGTTVLTPNDPRSTAAPAVGGTATTGSTLTATAGTWAGTGMITTGLQWQRSTATGWASVPGATGTAYVLTAADQGVRLRAVATARNWISSVSQAASAPTAVVTQPGVVQPQPQPRPEPQPPAPAPGPTPVPGLTSAPGPTPTPTPPITEPGPASVRLDRLAMRPRRFPVTRPRGSRTRLGTTVTWRVSRAAALRIQVQSRTRRGWRTVGTITRRAPRGSGTLRFGGRVAGKTLAAGRHRLVVTASAGGRTSGTRTVAFTVVRG